MKNTKHEGSTLTLAEAVDTLSHIAEIDVDKKVDEEEELLELEEDSLAFRTVHWIQHHEAKETMPLVRDIFKVILKYLKNFYESENADLSKRQVIEEIKTIMVLVGEAARKLDKLTKLFHKTRSQSVTKLKEYNELQEFYRNHISRAIDDNVIGRWILEMTKKKALHPGKQMTLRGRQKGPIDHLVIDLEAVKKDTEYELFFMRKEDGTRFFNPHMIRNIKLISDFGGYFGQEVVEDPLTSIDEINSRVANSCAKHILKAVRPLIDKFFRSAMKHRDMDVVCYTSDAIMALFMAANPSTLYRDPRVKDSARYFSDFRRYLHSALTSFDYQRLVVYVINNPGAWSASLLDVLHAICTALFAQINGIGEMHGTVRDLIDDAGEGVSSNHGRKKGCWDTLAGDYSAMMKHLKGHKNGPINIVLDLLEHGEVRGFDPLNLGIIPSVEYEIYNGERKYVVARWPTPTAQESVNKAVVADEFKGFLRDALSDRLYKKCLLVNFQDRLTAKEYYRANALEGLGHSKEFAPCIDVITISKDADFYHQHAPYNTCNHTHTFIHQFQEQLREGGGYWFPEEIVKKGKLPEFCKTAMEAINRLFFSSKNTLTLEQRLNFIEIFNLFLIMRVVDMTKPEVIGLCCKDGVDVSVPVAAELFVLIKLMHQESLSKEDLQQLNWLIYSPAILYRERLIQPVRFQRMLSAIRLIESAQKQYGRETFSKLIHEAFGDLLFKGKVR